MKDCIIKNCKRKYLAKGYCRLHYERLRKGQDLETPSLLDSRPAIIEGGVAKIPLGINAKDGYALVDVEFSWLDKYKWYAHNGYAVRNSDYIQGGKRTVLRMHREIVKTPEGLETDHVNGDKLDNRSLNLRACTKAENQHNRSKQRGTSVYKGIYWNKKARKWVAQLQLNGEKVYLGLYEIEEDAARSYKKAADEYFGEFARKT